MPATTVATGADKHDSAEQPANPYGVPVKPYDRVSAILGAALPATWKMVLIAIAHNLRPDGRPAYPALRHLAARAGLSERGVRKSLRALEAEGLIVVEGATGYANRYHIRYPDLPRNEVPEGEEQGSGVGGNVVPPPVDERGTSFRGEGNVVPEGEERCAPEEGKQEGHQEGYVHASDVEAAAPPAEEPPAQPARTHGTPLKRLLSSDLVRMLGAAGITEVEELLDYNADGLAEVCRPNMSRGRINAIDAALRKWTRQQGEERGLRACEPRPQASAEDGQPAEAWQLLLRGLSRFEQRPPWTTTPTDDGWALPGDEDRWRAAILAAGEEPDLITSWRVLYLRAGEQDRRWQERRFATAWRRALRGAA